MSREIKFRAWDSLEKKMLFFELKDYQAIMGLIAYTGDFYTKLTIMQYTGLKDKNGVEIYEGDIVKTKYETMPPISIMYRDGGYYYSPPKKKPDTDRLFCVCEFTTESDKVIGNIHQNPKLLENPNESD